MPMYMIERVCAEQLDLYEAPSPDVILAAAQRVGIPADAVVEVNRVSRTCTPSTQPGCAIGAVAHVFTTRHGLEPSRQRPARGLSLGWDDTLPQLR